MNFLKRLFQKKEIPKKPTTPKKVNPTTPIAKNPFDEIKIKFTVTESEFILRDINGNEMSEEIEKEMEYSRNQQLERKIRREERRKKIDEIKLTIEEPSEWLKDYLQRNRSYYENVPYKVINDLYFENMKKQNGAMANNDYKEAYINAELTLPLLEKFIQGQYSEYGSFDIRGIPCVEFCMEYTSLMGLVGGFKNISEIINHFPETKLVYQEELEKYRILMELSKKIRKIVKSNGGILQNTLKKELIDYDPKLITSSCKDMDRFGLLKREKVGNTYKLYLTY